MSAVPPAPVHAAAAGVGGLMLDTRDREALAGLLAFGVLVLGTLFVGAVALGLCVRLFLAVAGLA